ncbi:MAG: RNA polymerase factor sigma-54 [Candidatus Competibacter sp.]|nr:RNA polymerase factor sigma-54 [Candidatus Competibacteraceae bacterium]MBK7982762.1 RNA polymerase factor sigma-54 [Candidatus Competibacteraceae bacterium]MBK8962491.1 RNA polymerase factor sigma-54 [Candidatus Competibacteraceae bacterium]
MRPSFQQTLRQTQQLTMTPQLQQAIRLLQLSSLDLETEVQAILDSNLMLERIDEPQELPVQPETLVAQAAADSGPETELDISTGTLPDELPVDSAWEDVYEPFDGATSYSRGEEEEWDLYERYAGAGESLRDYLYWQMRLTPFGARELALATTIIDAINEAGYLTLSLEEICQGVRDEAPLTPAEAEAVLRVVQHFDPQGVGARTPAECLLLQLEVMPPDTPWLDQARRLVEWHLELLADRDFNGLMRRLKVSREDLQGIISLIQSLDPHPGERLSNNAPQYVVPDVLVYRNRSVWRVELNPESTPKLRINARYAALTRQARHNGDAAYLKNHLQEARWFLKSLQNRNETLLKVASSIVERQREFLERGDEFMKPLILRDIAEELSMHESTISRVTTQKYMHTPRGIYELKFFFSSHVGTSDGGECSSTAIRAMIRKLIQSEEPGKPLSDDKIAKQLEAEGIQVARRTVAKYREAMSIPSSSDRKRLV